jgi:hypothetical protein
LLIVRPERTLCTIKYEVFSMKTSNLVALIIALIVSTGGFEAINLLFTQSSSSHERPSEALILSAEGGSHGSTR